MAEDGGEGGRLLQIGVSGLQGRDAGGPMILHYLQRGGGCGDAKLGCNDLGERGRAEWVRTRGHTPIFPLLRG